MSTDYLKNCPHGMGGTVTKCVICERDMAPSPSEMTAAEALEALDVHRQHCPRGYHCSEPCECPVGAALPTLRAAVEERDQFSVQLAGCLMASEGSIETTADRVLPGDYAWSLALDKVRALREERDALETRRANLRECLDAISGIMVGIITEKNALRSELARVREALAGVLGYLKGRMDPEEWEEEGHDADLDAARAALSPAAPQEGE